MSYEWKVPKQSRRLIANKDGEPKKIVGRNPIKKQSYLNDDSTVRETTKLLGVEGAELSDDILIPSLNLTSLVDNESNRDIESEQNVEPPSQKVISSDSFEDSNLANKIESRDEGIGTSFPSCNKLQSSSSIRSSMRRAASTQSINKPGDALTKSYIKRSIRRSSSMKSKTSSRYKQKGQSNTDRDRRAAVDLLRMLSKESRSPTEDALQRQIRASIKMKRERRPSNCDAMDDTMIKDAIIKHRASRKSSRRSRSAVVVSRRSSRRSAAGGERFYVGEDYDPRPMSRASMTSTTSSEVRRRNDCQIRELLCTCCFCIPLYRDQFEVVLENSKW